MTYEQFQEILLEEGYNVRQILALWNTRPHNDLNEEGVRVTAREVKERLIKQGKFK